MRMASHFGVRSVGVKVFLKGLTIFSLFKPPCWHLNMRLVVVDDINDQVSYHAAFEITLGSLFKFIQRRKDW